MSTLAHCLSMEGKYQEAEVVAREVLALAQKGDREYPEVASVLHRLANIKIGEQKYAEAEDLARRSVEMHRRLHGNEHPETAWALLAVGSAFAAQHKNSEADAALRESLAIFRRYYGEDHESIGFVHANLIPLLERQGNQAALKELRLDHTLRQTKALEREADGLKVRIQLGDIHRDAGDLDGALTAYAEILARGLPETAAVSVRTGFADQCSALGRLLRDKQKYEEAARAYQMGITAREALGKQASPSVRLAQSIDYHDLAFVLLPATRPADAEVAVRKSIELKQDLLKHSGDNLDYRMHLAESYLGLGLITRAAKPAEAMQAYRDATGILNQLAAEESATEALRVSLGHTFWQMASAWSGIKRLDEAEMADQQGLKTFVALAAADPANPFYRQEQGYSLQRLAGTAMRADRTDDAKNHLRDAMKVYGELLAGEPTSALYRGRVSATAGSLADIDLATGHWQDAANALMQAAKAADPGDPAIWGRLATIRLAAHDEAGYRQACSHLVEHYSDAGAAFETAWECVLLPDAGVDHTKVVRIAEAAVARNPRDPDFLLTLGAALYRGGSFEKAAKTLADAEAAFQREKLAPSPSIYVSTTPLYADLFLAMTHQRLNHREDAQQWLNKASQAIDHASTTSPAAAKWSWKRRLILPLLRQEAEKLMILPAE
jgi:hypothetical protein